MSEKSEPALSAEEWNRREIEFGEKGWAHVEGVYSVCGDVPPALEMDDLYVGTYDSEGTANGGMTINPESRRKLAALALYGQSFGFSREDVDAIRLVHVSRREVQALLDSVADRIEALLPPESPTRDDGEGWEG